MYYCDKTSQEEGLCIISNEIIQTQWMNNFHQFDEGYTSHLSVDINYKGELFISTQKIYNGDNFKYIQAFSADGRGLFHNETYDTYYSYKKLKLPLKEYVENSKYIEYKGKPYLIGNPTENGIYLIDYMNNEYSSFSMYPLSYYPDNIFEIYGYNDIYFTDYVNCDDAFRSHCYLEMKIFTIESSTLNILERNTGQVEVQYGKKLTCLENEDDFIQCVYTVMDSNSGNYTRILGLFNPLWLSLDFSFELEKNFRHNAIFDSMIALDDNNVFVIAYSSSENEIKVILKKLEYIESPNKNEYIMSDYIEKIPYILINSDSEYDFTKGYSKRNSLCEINDKKFAMFVESVSNDIYSTNTFSDLIIFIFTIFNAAQNVNVRHYIINFELYGKRIDDQIKGYTLNDFLGVVVGLSPTSETYKPETNFMTFGYVNASDPEIDTKLNFNNENSTIKMSDYFYGIENNLFGYEFLGIKVLKLPDENKSGYFIDNKTKNKIKENDIISIDTTLLFKLNESFVSDIYSIELVGVVKEPDYDTMNEYAVEVETYPNAGSSVEKIFYFPKNMTGKKLNFRFRLSNCYEACEDCYSLTDDENNQRCKNCKEGYYFADGTYNCFSHKDYYYYFNKETNRWSPCNENCLTCEDKALNILQMNCKSCEPGFKLYESSNCLNCTYVNYIQTECIDEIPDGYYLKDKEYGTIDKCYPLCKTCNGAEYYQLAQLHMNCKTCLYENKNYKPNYEGNCPEFPEEEKEEEDEEVIDNCPKNTPILKNEKCQSIYCTKEEYKNKTCILSNTIIKNQWMNYLYEMDFDYTTYLSATMNPKGEIFLSAQEIEGTNYKYLIGISENGTGLFYNKTKDSYDYFMKFEIPNRVYIDNMKYIEINNKGYLISVPYKDDIFLFDYNENKYYRFDLRYSASSGDNLFKLINTDDLYFTDYKYCKDTYLNDCYLHMKIYQINSTENLVVKLNITHPQKIDYRSKLACEQHDEKYIQCIYRIKDENTTLYKRYLTFYNSQTLEEEYLYELESDDITDIPFFDSMINLKNNIYVIAYNTHSTNNNTIKLLIKTVDYENNVFTIKDYINSISSVYINEDSKYLFKGTSFLHNSLMKFDDYKFIMLLRDNTERPNSSENSILVVILFQLYNNDQNLSVKYYSFNFKLNNYYVWDKMLGYKLNNYFGVLTKFTDLNKVYSSGRATYMTFGYVNSTEQNPSIDLKLNFNNSDSVIILKNYIKGIENNLFGYKFNGVRIISLPDETQAGYFINNKTNEKIKENDIIENNTTLRFIVSEYFDNNIYSIQFAGEVTEPEFIEIQNYTDKMEFYPLNDENSEETFYKPNTFLGKIVNYRFKLNKCYPSCATCRQTSKDDKQHLCTECNKGYYFIEGTTNCYDKLDENYFFDENKKEFIPCYIKCKTCNGKSLNDLQMNCKTCKEDYKLYDSTNCLNCQNYVNFIQSECLDKIPDGYYLLDEKMGTLGKCHSLCKTCEGPSFYFPNKTLSMNCTSCLYINKKNTSLIPGNCPDQSYEGDDKEECPREKPIFKDNECHFVYCTDSEFEKQKCIISNSYVKTQWFNNFHIFDDDKVSYIASEINEKGDVFLLAQREDEGKYIKYLYAFNKDGRGLFHNRTSDTYYSFKILNLSDGAFVENINYFESGDDEYLITTIINDTIFIINYQQNDALTVKSDILSYKSDTFFKLKGTNNTYFADFVNCKDEYGLEKCRINMRKYDMSTKEFKVIQEDLEPILVDKKTKISCFQKDLQYIECVLTITTDADDEDDYESFHILSLFEIETFHFEKTWALEYDYNRNSPIDSIILLKENITVIAYSQQKNIIKVLIKNITVEKNGTMTYYSMEDYIPKVEEILLNEDNLYEFEGGNYINNNLYKISEDKFVLLMNNLKDDDSYPYYNSAMVLFVFSIYNKNQYINVRHYPIDFRLYNLYIDGELRGYNLNGFFGLELELTSPKSPFSSRAVFLTLGYVNTTQEINDITNTTKYLIEEKNPLILSNYITEIENNLFGYQFLGVKIITLPPSDVGSFYISNNNNTKIKVKDIIDKNSELIFNKNDDAPKGDYYISFAGVVGEPDYETMNNFCTKLQSYPKEYLDDEKKYYLPKILVGKEYKYEFRIGEPQKECYDSCETCYEYSDNINDHKCKICKNNFYFKDNTNNCYDKAPYKYFFNTVTKTYSPCYTNCVTCNAVAINKNKMNCLTCDKKFKYYEKSTNCLNCPKYVNLQQTDCIDTIPDGYYLSDSYLGTIDRCHYLCKTCDQGSKIEEDSILHMHCLTCLYKDDKFVPSVVGNCPSSDGKEEKEEEKEDEKEDEKEEEKEKEKEKEKEEEKKKEDDNKSEEGKGAVFWVIMSLSGIIVVMVVIIIVLKCLRKHNNVDIEEIDKFKGNIPLDDEKAINN